MDIKIEDLTDDQLKQASDEMQRRERRATLLDSLETAQANVTYFSEQLNQLDAEEKKPSSSRL